MFWQRNQDTNPELHEAHAVS